MFMRDGSVRSSLSKFKLDFMQYVEKTLTALWEWRAGALILSYFLGCSHFALVQLDMSVIFKSNFQLFHGSNP